VESGLTTHQLSEELDQQWGSRESQLSLSRNANPTPVTEIEIVAPNSTLILALPRTIGRM
jgi:hypothetical protein